MIDRKTGTHLLQTGNGQRVSAADTKVRAIRDTAEIRWVVAKGKSNLADVLLVGSGVLAGEGRVVVVDFGVKVRHGGDWYGS
jgi:hypothetical protein